MFPELRWGTETSSVEETLAPIANEDSQVLPLLNLAPAERQAQLEAIASGEVTLDQVRARYLLAVDLIESGQGSSALPWLEGLEEDYTLLAPHVLAKRAQAYTAMGDKANADAIWQEILATYPDDPVAAEALFQLGTAAPDYWQEAIARFPSHPRTVQIAQTSLQQTDDPLPYLMIMIRHGLYLPDIGSVLAQVTNDYGDRLTPEEWEAVAFGYWELGRYGSGGYAYGQATVTPQNLYRAGRGAQLGERNQDAVRWYRQLAETFPDAEETGLALVRLGRMVDDDREAIAYLDQALEQFPEQAGAALLERANRLDALNSSASASQARQSVLTQYSNSEAAGELRWMLVEQRFEAGDIQGAWEMARELVRENPNHDYAPEAAFWIGKWANQIGQADQARESFEYVLTHYPESYYAWRSAVYLGWDVGDFTTVRSKLPDVERPEVRSPLTAGSEVLQELHLLGQHEDAWSRWQVEFTNPMAPSVAEQFTDGVLRLGVGDNLDGIFMVSSLAWRENPADQAAYQELKQNPDYWQALYPFPYLETIESWSQDRQLNPLLVTGLIRQESRFEPEIVSSAGATGLMQVMPDTGDWIAEIIALPEFDLNNPDDNIKLGTWYLDYTHREYSDNSLFAIASYNAGPGNVADWIARFGADDPDVFVEMIPFPETKGYVEAVFENYWNYLRIYNPEVSQQLAQLSPAHESLVSETP
jgi:soluble lytic murein transglycosylase